jgi:hypothetical protein
LVDRPQKKKLAAVLSSFLAASSLMLNKAASWRGESAFFSEAGG